jgi:hypothetical protein
MTMSITAVALPYGSPYGELYDPAMPRTKTMGVEALRKVLGPELEKSAKDETHIVVSKHGIAQGVFVPMSWYRKAREALNEPTDL